ncbi:hypothetical protein KJY73_18050 [Bowmanella sp. Y26]|uniref:hypothetical protein n=1 Tax=Bowmanella yangjiangensis TaxID=2811230 RepID=UPI001BDD9282|nr:hypothetical protein [Bowmanella yangjiangensis]MBT1065495.1 hypothetical protein [Bowmanella yangjiangensis]
MEPIAETVDAAFDIEVALFEPPMRGREGYVSGVQPNHLIPGKDYFFIGRVEFEGKKWLKPGEKCKARLECIIPKADLELFAPGFAWHICEAYKVVGYAKVI